MPLYRSKINSDDSEYESDGETTYKEVQTLGKGNFAVARLFQSHNNKTVAVLKPKESPGDYTEATVKHRFFRALYPSQQSHLFPLDKDYRLVVPYLPHIPYEKLSVHTPEFQKDIFCSAIQALKDCHDKGIIYIDLMLDNPNNGFNDLKKL